MSWHGATSWGFWPKGGLRPRTPVLSPLPACQRVGRCGIRLERANSSWRRHTTPRRATLTKSSFVSTWLASVDNAASVRDILSRSVLDCTHFYDSDNVRCHYTLLYNSHVIFFQNVGIPAPYIIRSLAICLLIIIAFDCIWCLLLQLLVVLYAPLSLICICTICVFVCFCVCFYVFLCVYGPSAWNKTDDDDDDDNVSIMIRKTYKSSKWTLNNDGVTTSRPGLIRHTITIM